MNRAHMVAAVLKAMVKQRNIQGLSLRTSPCQLHPARESLFAEEAAGELLLEAYDMS